MPNPSGSDNMHHPFVIGVGGFTSSVGKTTLICDLLHAFPEWEAIKTTRGHYRSCGKSADTCCVSHLLSQEAVIRSGREQTYAPNKDTGRYWDAGAANVHWLIATDDQIEEGIKQVLERVRTSAVIVEGNSFSRFIDPSYFVMVKRSDREKIKKSARESLSRASAIYLSHDGDEHSICAEHIRLPIVYGTDHTLPPMYTRKQLPELIAVLRTITGATRGVLPQQAL